MGEEKYNKLVRDRIPELLRQQGKVCETVVLSDREYIEKLKEKLKEEVDDFIKAQPDKLASEIADVLEVLYALAEHKGISEAELDFTRQMKKRQRGSYRGKVLLKSVNTLQ